MNKETIKGLKKRRESLERKIKRLNEYYRETEKRYLGYKEELSKVENDLEGLNELLAPHETLEKL